jgi:hypothetical protein
MKNKIKTSLVLTIALVSVGFAFATVSAQEAVAVKPEKAVEAQASKGENSNTVKNTIAQTDATTTTDETEDSQNKSKKDKVKEEKVQVTGEEHRSAVATFVKSLLIVADREGGIGQQVKVIAQEQNASKEKVAEAIDDVEKRGKIKTFFLGTDYENVGKLRGQMVQTRNQIDQLKRLADKAENPQDKTELQAQIQTLEQQQTTINNLITSNEAKFSLFGWAVKLLTK